MPATGRPVRALRSSSCLPLAALGALLCALFASPPAMAQTVALYGLNENGQLTVNGSILDGLPGKTWEALVVVGSDRWALRDDGRIYMNGAQLYKLDCEDNNGNDVNEGDWIGLAVVGGDVWALSTRGYLSKNGSCATQFPPGDFVFVSLFSDTVNTWALRSDGALFENTIVSPTFQLIGGPGIDDAAEGEAPDTTWVTGAVGTPLTVFALRADGTVVSGNLLNEGDDIDGTIVATLPFGNSGQRYVDIAFTPNGLWNVLRSNGEVYNEQSTLNPVIDFNGSSDSNQQFAALLPLPEVRGTTTDASYFALRADGGLFRETSQAEAFDLPKSNYGELAFSSSPPDLTTHKDTLPVVATYAVKAIEGTPFAFPILATDTDIASEDLVVTVDETTLPEGSTYDGKTRTVSWDSPVAGSYKVQASVDDGSGVVKKTFKIKVSPASTNPDKNTKPKVSKIKNVQGLVGFPLVVPILASDAEGNALTISVDDSQVPFTLGATFDDETNTFNWPDAELNQVGTYSVVFTVSDGTAQSQLKVKIKMVSSFLTF